MRTNYFNRRSVAINRVFNEVEVNANLDKFENILSDGCLVTTFDGREVCRTDVSKVYYNFDFSDFSKNIVTEVQQYFTPEKYRLKAASGIQEIKLIGGELYIDNERYEKMISIINSTDKSTALSMNIGLVKITKSGYITSYTILTSFTNKHYKSSLPDKIKSFSDNLINFNMNIDFQIKTIEDLKTKDVSILEFVKAMMIDKNDKVIKSVDLKLQALGKSLKYKSEFKDKYKTLSNLTSTGVEDFTINSKVLYDAYVALFKDSNTSVIARECRRVVEALDKI